MRLVDSRIATFLFLVATSAGAVAQAQSQSAGPTGDVAPAQTRSSTSAPPSIVVIAGVEAFWSADLNAKTAGYVTEVKADIGDHVTKGQVLAVLHVPELEKNLVQAKAGLAARRQMKKAADAAVVQAQQALSVAQSQLDGYAAELALQKITLKRQEELSEGKATTPQQLDEIRSKAQIAQANVGMGEAKVGSAKADILAAEANRDVAAAQVDVADAAVQEVQALLEYTKITAPFDGVITKRQVNPGDLVQAAVANRAMPLFTVQQLDTVRVMCDVPELQAAGVAVGAAAEVKVYGLDGQSVAGKVTRIATAVDPASRTMRVEIDLKNANETLRPGTYAQVTIALRPPPHVADATQR